MEILLITSAGILLLGLTVLLYLRKLSSPETTTRILLGVYRTFERKGASEGERLFQILATRGGWRSLPAPVLRELAARLASKEDVIGSVILAERDGLLESNRAWVGASNGAQPESSSLVVDQVGVALMNLHSRLAQRAILGPGFAMVGGEWRPLPKWAVRIDQFLDRAETAISHRAPLDAELALRLARRIERLRANSPSPRAAVRFRRFCANRGNSRYGAVSWRYSRHS